MAYEPSTVTPPLNLADYNKVIYVKKSGDDTLSGLTVAKALLTINKAMTKIVSGDNALIIIGVGGYTEKVTGPSVVCTVTLYGDKKCNYFSGTPGSWSSVLSTSYPIVNAQYIKAVHNMQFYYTGTTTSSFNRIVEVAGQALTPTECTFYNCNFNNSINGSICYHGNSAYSNVTFNNCQFTSQKSGANPNLHYSLNLYKYIYNDCDFANLMNIPVSSTSAGSILQFASQQFYRCSNIFLNSSIDVYTSKGNCEYIFEDCGNIKINSSNNYSFLFSCTNTDIYGVRGNSRIKNCTVVDMNGMTINSKQLYYLENYGYTSVDIDRHWLLRSMYPFDVENCNEITGRVTMLPDFMVLEDNDLIYNGRPVICQKLTSSTFGNKIAFRFYADAGTPLTFKVPLKSAGDTISGSISVIASGSKVSDTSLGFKSFSIPVAEEFTVVTQTFTPIKEGFHYLQVNAGYSTGKLYIGEITIA